MKQLPGGNQVIGKIKNAAAWIVYQNQQKGWVSLAIFMHGACKINAVFPFHSIPKTD